MAARLFGILLLVCAGCAPAVPSPVATPIENSRADEVQTADVQAEMAQADEARAEVAQTDDPADGQQLYQVHCGVCHGHRGEGGEGPALAVPTLVRAATPEQLSNIILRGIPNTGMPRTRLDREQLAQVVAFVTDLGKVPTEPITGDARRGEQVYADAGCAQCHVIGNRGGVMGPDLSRIGMQRGASHLRASLIDPNADVPKSFSMMRSDVSIAQNFLQVRAVTRDGAEIEGVRVNEDTFSIQLRDADDRIHSFYKSELAQLDKQKGKSPMPGYGDMLSKEEIDDLVAYLASLRGA